MSHKRSAPRAAEEGAAARDVLAKLRELDRDRYLAALLVPERHRTALATLWLFNAEIGRLRDVVREPMAGEIRLQWWSDALGAGAAGHPTADALIALMEARGLPLHAFQTYLTARIFDLYDDPMPDRDTFETYAGETASILLQLGALVIDADRAGEAAEVAGHGGVLQVIAGTLLLMPIHCRRGQLFVPGDIVKACGLDRKSFLSGKEPEKAVALRAALAAYGAEHLARTRQAAAGMPTELFSAFLPLALAAQVVEYATQLPKNADPRNIIPLRPQWRRQFRLFLAATRGVF